MSTELKPATTPPVEHAKRTRNGNEEPESIQSIFGNLGSSNNPEHIKFAREVTDALCAVSMIADRTEEAAVTLPTIDAEGATSVEPGRWLNHIDSDEAQRQLGRLVTQVAGSLSKSTPSEERKEIRDTLGHQSELLGCALRNIEEGFVDGVGTRLPYKRPVLKYQPLPLGNMKSNFVPPEGRKYPSSAS